MSLEEGKKPIYKKWWFWLIIAVVALAIIGIVAGTAGGGDDGKDPDTGDKPDPQPGPAYYIGDTVKSGTLEFTVDSVSDTTLLGTEYLGVSTENNFLVAEISIKNTGDAEVSLISSYFELIKGTAKYEVHSGSIYLENGFYVIKPIGPGLSLTIAVAFETPSKSSADTYTLNVKGSSFSKAGSIVLTTK